MVNVRHGYSPDRHQTPVRADRFDVRRSRIHAKRRDIEIPSLPDVGDRNIVHENRRELRQQFAVSRRALPARRPSSFSSCNCSRRRRLFDPERPRARTHERIDMGAAAERHSELVRDAPDVGPGRTANPQPGAVAFQFRAGSVRKSRRSPARDRRRCSSARVYRRARR